jgi:hypothetical protein
VRRSERHLVDKRHHQFDILPQFIVSFPPASVKIRPQLQSVQAQLPFFQGNAQKEKNMKSASNKFAVAVGAFGNYSNSKVVPQSWNGQSALFLPISASSSDDPIAGVWHVTFTAKGNEAGPPDGAPRLDSKALTTPG